MLCVRMPKADPSWAREVVRGGCRVPGCPDPDCSVEYGRCHCRCGKETTRARQSDRRLNLVNGEPQRYVNGHQLRQAVETRWEASAADRAAERAERESVCAREGCGNMFTPTPSQLARGVGRYCSPECARRRYPEPGFRVCAREGCDHEFRPYPSTAAQGRGLYCSRRCADLGKLGRVGKKAELVCAQCDRARHVRRWYLERGQRFCSSQCWWEWRLRHAFDTLNMGGRARRKLAGAFGKLGGRPRGYTELQQRGVLALRAETGWGIRRLAARSGLSEMQVRAILSSSKG